MIAPRLHRCPSCSGPRLLDDVTRLRIHHHRGCPFLSRELERQAADVDLARRRVGPWTRPVTFVERELVTAAGYRLADDAECQVQFLTPSLRVRTFTDRLGRVVDLDDRNVPSRSNTSSSDGDEPAGEGAA